MKITILYLYNMIGAVLVQSIVKPPTDTTGTIGGTAKFECEVQYGDHVPSMTWLFNNKVIYSYKDRKVEYPSGTNKYVVTDSHTTFTLEARNLNYTDGGNYLCNVLGHEASAALIVLGTPVITITKANLMEGMIATYTCEARFGGPSIDNILHDHPEMKLFLDDTIYPAILSNETYNYIQKVYKIPVDDSMDNKDLKCEIGTTKSKKTFTSSTEVNVEYSVRNTTYSPQEEKYEYGSNITCSARGNPFPKFEWRNINNARIVNKGNVLHITEEMKGKNTWTCTARNYVDGEIHEYETTANFEAVSNKLQPDEVDLHPVFFLIAAGGVAVGILGFIAYRRFGALIKKFTTSTATPSLYVTTAATVFGSSFQHGWNTGVLNIPQVFIKKFISESFMEHNGFKPSSDQLEMLWAVCVSIYLLSGFLGVLVAGKLADKLGRKYALQFCHIFTIIGAVLFGFCKMAHSFEMLLFGRFIVGFGCGAGSRLVIMYLSEIAPDDIQNEVLMAHRFCLTFGILLSQIAGLYHCLGNESLWPYLLSLTALPCVPSFLILLRFPQSPVDHLMKFKRAQEKVEKNNENGMEKKKEKELEKGVKKEVVESDLQKSHQVMHDPHRINAGPEKIDGNVISEIDSNCQEANMAKDMGKPSEDMKTENKQDKKNKHYDNAKKAYSTFQKNDFFEMYWEKFSTAKKVTVRELFQPEWKDLYPCIILMCCLNICQQLSGINILFYYSLNIFESSGVPPGIIGYCVVSTGVTDVLMSGVSIVGHFKHRNLLLIGELIMIISSLLIMLALHLKIFYISIISVNTFVWGFALGFGSITTYIGKELFFPGPNIPAITIARSCNWLANFFVALVYPVLHLRAGPNSFWIFTSFLLVFIVYFFIKLPETKDRNRKDIYNELKIKININWNLGDDTTQQAEEETENPESLPLLEIRQIPTQIPTEFCSTTS